MRAAIGIGAVALTLAGGLAPGLVDAKDDKGRDATGRFNLTCNGVSATILMAPNSGPVYGTNGRDVVFGTDGRDVFVGNGGDDLVCLGGGNDEFRPGSNAGSIYDGNDTVYGGFGGDTLTGGRGDDKLYGEGDNDAIRGQEGTNDLCNGGPGGGDYQLGDGGCEVLINIP